MQQSEIYCLGDSIGRISLIDYMGDETKIINAARVSMGKSILKMEDKDIKLLEYLIKHKHETPLEHVSFTFLVKCPLYIARQWLRHRIGSFNEISARYTEIKEEFYIPLEFKQQSDVSKQCSTDLEVETPNLALDSYKKALKQSYEQYQNLLLMGVSREQARGVLPTAMYTEFYWSINLRALLNFLELRLDKHAQREMQEYSKAIVKLIQPLVPNTLRIKDIIS